MQVFSSMALCLQGSTLISQGVSLELELDLFVRLAGLQAPTICPRFQTSYRGSVLMLGSKLKSSTLIQ